MVKLLALERRFQGHMTRPMTAHTYPPRRISMKRGRRAVISVPADTELAAMLVPSWARANAVAMKNTPARFPDPPSSRND